MAKKLVGQLGEWGLLDRFLPDLSRRLPASVKVGPGDDAAVLAAPGGWWAVTTDMLVEGVHFRREWTSGRDLGHKSLAVNLSDLAAMGNIFPWFGVVSLGITPQMPVGYVDSFYKGLQKLAKLYKLRIVGGDTVRADRVTVSITVVGRVGGRKGLILRSGARAGDVLMATGTLGDAAGGLEILEKGGGCPPAARGFLVGRLLRPTPRLDLARRLALRGGVTSLMDSSDGFWRSVQILCRASRTGARVQADRLPCSAALRRWAGARKRSPFDYALTGGEDYELVLTAAPEAARFFESKGWARAVGRIVPRAQGIRVEENGQIRRVPREFEHFA